MSDYLAFFPLELVVFPSENLNLHVFEERYKKLIQHCQLNRFNFGIPSLINGRLSGYGTEVKILSIAKTYPNGEMDIRTKGGRPFRMLSFREGDDLNAYAEGEVEYLEYFMNEDKSTYLKLTDLLRSFYELSGSEYWIDLDEAFTSFDVGHKIGLKPEEELELFKLKVERDRQLYLIEHLKKMIPTLQRVQEMNFKIKQNGHFKKLP